MKVVSMFVACRYLVRMVGVVLLACLWVASGAQTAGTGPEPNLQTAEKPAYQEKGAPKAAPERRWVQVPRLTGRLTAKDIGLVINTADPYSVAVGEYYARRRRIPPDQVLRVDIPVKTTLNVVEFGELYARIRDHMGPQVQGLALALFQFSQRAALYRSGVAAVHVAGLTQREECEGDD